MTSSPRRVSAEVSTSSMADIAFLLLTFFLVTTVMKENKGLVLMLPPLSDQPVSEPVHARNVFTIQINSTNEYLVEGEVRAQITGLRKEIQTFIMNKGADQASSDSPEKAVVSLKTDRGTSQAAFVKALDEIQAAYYELYAEQAGITPAAFRKLDLLNPQERAQYDKGRRGIPMNISMAEPVRTGF